MLLAFTIFYFLLCTKYIDAGIQVQGHIEMGENIAKLFNDIVDQFQPNNLTSILPSFTSKIASAPGFDPVRLTDDVLHPPEPVVMVPENDDADLPVVKLDDNYYDQVPSAEEVEPTEVPLLSKIMREPKSGVVHLYGHHRFNEVREEPRNNVNI